MTGRQPQPPRDDQDNERWIPRTNRDWAMWAGARLYVRGISDPKPLHLLEEARRSGAREFPGRRIPSLRQIRKAKDGVLDSWTTWESVAREMARRTRSEQLSDARDRLLGDCQERLGTDEAREFVTWSGRQVFCGNLLWFEPYRRTWQVRWHEVNTIFEPRFFPETELGSHEETALRRLIRNRLDQELSAEIDRFVAGEKAKDAADPRRRGLGSNNLRAMLHSVLPFPEDHVGAASRSRVKPLRLIYGPTDWDRIEGFNNRMLDDRAFRQRAIEQGWVAGAVPESAGRTPSYVVSSIIITGGEGGEFDPYLVLSQRLSAQRVRYFPHAWSISLEENMQGPRIVTRHGREVREKGDASLHECALRGLREEFGVAPLDVADLLLLGLFIEAPTAAMVGIFWAHLKLSWEQFLARFPEATDPEAKVIAREPLATSNMVELFLREEYCPRGDNGRDYVASGGTTNEPAPFHPSSRPRLLAYLLTDTKRHPLGTVVQEFRKVGWGQPAGSEGRAITQRT